MNLRTLLLVSLLAMSLATPFVAQAQYVTCGWTKNADATDVAAGRATKVGEQYIENPCDFWDIIVFARFAIKGWIGIGAAIATMVFAYAGYLYITAAGNMESVKHAHSIFLKVAVGFFFMLAAWLIVKALEAVFLSDPQKERSFLGQEYTKPVWLDHLS